MERPPEISILGMRPAPGAGDAVAAPAQIETPPVAPEPATAPPADLGELDPVGDPPAASQLRVAASALRCPFCHDKVELHERCACAECLAVHHVACWEEHPRCAACGGAHQLAPTGEPPPPPPPKRSLAERRPTDFPLPDPCHPAAAATYLGVTLLELNHLISSGQLSARQRGNDVVFSADAIRRLRSRLPELSLARPQRTASRLPVLYGLFEGFLWCVAALCAVLGVVLSFLGPGGLFLAMILFVPAYALYARRT